ncbi:MAG TPA: TIM barrel protein, partial [Puia sp.]|nr:TIM barrel protein [Puia sp.]
MGFTEVEVAGFYGLAPEQFRDALRKHQLRPGSVLFPYELFRDSLDKIIMAAKLLGANLVGCAWIPHQKTFSQQDADQATKLFNEAGEKLKQKGLHFFYHAHGYEFAPLPDGSTLFEQMAANMKAGTADFELDVFWAWHGGADPVLLMKKYPGRFIALHLKQMREGQPTGEYTGSAPDESSVSLGKGVMDFKLILQTAMQTGIDHFYIEDEASTAVPQVKASLMYLDLLRKN